MKRFCLVGITLSFLGACGGSGNGIGMAESPVWHSTASIEVKTEYFKKQCIGFGFKENTPELAQCIQTQMTNSRSDASARMDRAIANQQAIANANRVSTYNCTTFGRNTTCRGN